MEGNFCEFDGKVYAIDVEKLLKGITKPSETLKDRSKVETWGLTQNEDGTNDFRVLQKEVSESVSDGVETYSSIRYDFIKNILTLIMSPISDDNGSILRINHFEDMFFGQVIAFNTLLNEGIIIEINEE